MGMVPICPRTLVYMGVWAAIGLAMLFALGNRARLDVSVASDRNPPFMLLSDGSVRNAYKLNLRNMQNRPREMRIAIDGLPGGEMWSDEMSQDSASRTIELTVPADATRALRLYVAAPPGTEGQEFEFDVVSLDEERESDSGAATFAAPEAGQ